MKFESPKLTFLRPAALLFLIGAVSLACGSVSQSDDAGNGGAAGGGTAGVVGAGPPHAPNDGGASAGKSGSAGSAGTAGSAGSAGTHGGSDGGAGSGAAGKDGGAAGKDGGGLCLCDAIYSPVCGVDGKNYANACNAACAGVAVAHAGGCATGGTDGSVPLDYCDQASDCTTRPAGGCSCSQICVAKTDPVPASPPFTCDIACPLVVVACGCVNHQCTAGAATAVSP